MRERIAKVQNLLEKNNLDAFLFSSQPNVFYLSGFRSSHAYVVVSRHSYHLLTDGRYYQKAKEELKDWDVILLEGNVLKAIERLLKKIGAFKVGHVLWALWRSPSGVWRYLYRLPLWLESSHPWRQT